MLFPPAAAFVDRKSLGRFKTTRAVLLTDFTLGLQSIHHLCYFCYIVAVEFGKVDMNTSYKEGRHEDGSTLEPGSMPRGHSYNNTGNMGVSIINTWRTKEAALD
ncbi:uncharacterized protein LOC128840282 isoform X2 [Malaclemys terrapin pileata]|uniref:uncharacterized protein LOC128840282 isoform X2 n=1 Tax=Malaclemys terrapin pileata TaxID=2991368 RepID=UPI0023A7DFB5|nr:uncharacterized protein LOC128840282 isoform X2 [Malaclemys terrapin pileata]